MTVPTMLRRLPPPPRREAPHPHPGATVAIIHHHHHHHHQPEPRYPGAAPGEVVALLRLIAALMMAIAFAGGLAILHFWPQQVLGAAVFAAFLAVVYYALRLAAIEGSPLARHLFGDR